MRSLCMKIGLLLILIPAASFAEEQQDDKSYLPPVSLRAAPKANQVDQTWQARDEQEITKHARTHRRHIYRESPFPRFAGPRFYFGMF